MQAATNKKPGEGEKRKLYLQHDRVACFFEDLGWCLGTVVMRENNGRYVVLFDDGTTEKDIMFSELKDAVDARPNEAAAAGQSGSRRGPVRADSESMSDRDPGLTASRGRLRLDTEPASELARPQPAARCHDSAIEDSDVPPAAPL